MFICLNCTRAVAVSILAGSLTIHPLFSQMNLSETPTSFANAQPPAALAKDFQKRFTHISNRYKLTATQQVQVRSILLEEQRDQQTVFSDKNMSREDKRGEKASLFETSQQEIRAVLDTQQKRKFDADEQRRAWMDRRIPNPNSGPALSAGW